MSVVEELIAAQSARFAAIDPVLPPVAGPPAGYVLTARLPGDERVGGVLERHALPDGSPPTLWCALETWELHPVVGDSGGAGMAALLAAWRGWLDETAVPADSACLVTWPSRDAETGRSFLDHGLLPLSVTAVRPTAPMDAGEAEPDAAGLRVRRATPVDLDVAVDLAMAELEYSALVGGSVLRPGARAMKRGVLEFAIRQDEPVWLAEHNGVAVGLADCRWSTVAVGSWAAHRLPAGYWGHVNCLSVLPAARGTRVGRRLMAVVHRQFAAAGAVGSYLYYNPPNPLSSVFWPRQGYRPLWTQWEVRPATALR